MKKCLKCNLNKDVESFYIRKKVKNRKTYYFPCSPCKKCVLKNSSIWKVKARILRPWKLTLYKIRERCSNPNSANWKWYGKKGIKLKLSEKNVKFIWLRDKAYLMEKPTIDRKNSNGNYCLSNCRFIENRKNASLARKRKLCEIQRLTR